MSIKTTVPLLVVSDIAQSRDFYCDGLGFQVKNKWEDAGRLAWCWLKSGGAELMLQQSCEEDPPPSQCGKGITFYFICEDTDAIYRDLQSRGIEATEPSVTFYEMKQTFVVDPDGYALCFENPTGEGA